MKKLYFFAVIMLMSARPGLAGGFQLNLQGQKQTGMGHTGTGLLLDNAAILFNPGAVSFLDSLRGISFGGSFIFPRTTYLEPAPGTYTSQIEKNIGTPVTLYAVFKFKKNGKMECRTGHLHAFRQQAAVARRLERAVPDAGDRPENFFYPAYCFIQDQ